MIIPIILTVRQQSQRCPNKILRPFIGRKSLLDICLEKFRNNQNVYVAGYERIFKEKAKQYNIGFIQRSRESALSEDSLIIHSHLNDLEDDFVCQLNVCCPFVKAETVFKAIDLFSKNYTIMKSLFSVKESHELIFNNQKEHVNIDHIYNSKFRKPNFIGNNAILIYDRKFFLKTGKYWTYSENDPYLYVMSVEESIDIDTELDFKLAQFLTRKG